jgi:hypothetical protein
MLAIESVFNSFYSIRSSNAFNHVQNLEIHHYPLPNNISFILYDYLQGMAF